jgi:hypothetical protein
MGYSIRTNAWRFTVWVGWNGTTLTPEWRTVNATELYAHSLTVGGPSDQDFDAWENENLASKPEHNATMRTLMGQLRAHFRQFALPYLQQGQNRRVV